MSSLGTYVENCPEGFEQVVGIYMTCDISLLENTLATTISLRLNGEPYTSWTIETLIEALRRKRGGA